MKALFQDIIYGGFSKETSADVRRQVLISCLFSLIGSILLLAFGIDGLFRGNWLLSGVTFLYACILGANYTYIRRTGNYRVSSRIIVFLMISLCLYLLCSGGSGNTGPLWFFVLPSLIYYVLGLLWGTVTLAILLLVVLVLLLAPDNPLMIAQYSVEFLQRFFGALLSVSILALVYEYTREDGRRELIALSHELDLLSRRDELTGLANRRDIIEQLDGELSRFERNNRIFSILVADIDYFKDVNDTHGHECGDLVLQEIARVLRSNTQKRDCVSRWGGEEFLILLPETTGQQAVGTAERLRLAVENLMVICNSSVVSVTVSIGVAEFQSGMSLNDLINRADDLLYQAKASGRNRVIH